MLPEDTKIAAIKAIDDLCDDKPHLWIKQRNDIVDFVTSDDSQKPCGLLRIISKHNAALSEVLQDGRYIPAMNASVSI